jgi:hypothetical protein
MTVVNVDEGGGDEAATVAGQAAVVSGAALAGAADANANAGDAQAQAAQASQDAAQARAEAEAARIDAMDAKEATGTLAKLMLTREMANRPPEPEPVAVAAVVETPTEPVTDEPPRSVKKNVEKKSFRDRWGG